MSMGKVKSVEIEVGEELGSFSSEQDWVNRAKNLYAAIYEKIGSKDVVSLDSAIPRRIVRYGCHFRTAREEGTYPITIHEIRDSTDE